MDRREIRSYGILFNIFSSTNVKRIYILLLINCFVQSATACLTNRAKKNIYTEIKKRLKHQSQIITIILRPSPSSSILHPLRRPFLRSKDKRSKRSTAVDSQGQRCLKRRLVRRVTMLCGASCTAGATPGGFFERCGCSHPTRQKSVQCQVAVTRDSRCHGRRGGDDCRAEGWARPVGWLSGERMGV